MFDIPFELFVVYLASCFSFLVIGLVWNPKIPALIMLSGLLIFPMIALADNIVIGYTDERSINTNTVFIAGQAGSNVTLTHYDVITDSGVQNINVGLRIFGGEKATSSSSLIGDTVNTLTIRLSKTGTPPSNFLIGVWDCTNAPTNANYLALWATVSANSLTTTPTDYTYQFADYTITTNDCIGIYYNNGDGTNRIAISINTANPFDGTNTYVSFYNVGWSDQTANDYRMTLTHFITTEPEDSLEINSYDTVGNSPIMFELTEYPKLMFALVAMGLVFVGALIYSKEK